MRYTGLPAREGMDSAWQNEDIHRLGFLPHAGLGHGKLPEGLQLQQ